MRKQFHRHTKQQYVYSWSPNMRAIIFIGTSWLCLFVSVTLSLSLPQERIRIPSSLSSSSHLIQDNIQEVSIISSKAGKSKNEILEEEKHSFDDVFAALREYYEYHGNLALPRRYIVSNKNQGGMKFGKELIGVDLAGLVYKLEWWTDNVKGRPDRVSELNKIGFIWTRLQDDWNLIMEALCTYVAQNGDTMVPYSFVVPNDYAWPVETWGISLGSIVYRIRARGDFVNGRVDRVRQLNLLKFVWDVSEHNFFKFYRALKIYKQLQSIEGISNKVLRVKSTFVVPTNVTAWPKELHGYPLGAKCQAVIHAELYVKKNPERKHMLAALGFHWHGNADLGWLKTIHAAAIYSQIHGKVLDVPYKFVVPAPPIKESEMNENQREATEYCDLYGCFDEWPWPEHLFGFPLGQRLKDVRLKGAYLKGDCARARIAQLNALGFVWKPKRGRRRRNSSTQTVPMQTMITESMRKEKRNADIETRSIFSVPLS